MNKRYKEGNENITCQYNPALALLFRATSCPTICGERHFIHESIYVMVSFEICLAPE